MRCCSVLVRGLTVAPLLAALLLIAASARAAPGRFSDYEKETIDAALDQNGGTLEPRPEGKTIESIEIVTLEVIEDRDPVPKLFNVFHATTRADVIRDELLFAEGQRYDARRVGESARNLRSRRQLSLVLIVPLRGSRPDTIRMLVITKDVWSLRLNTNFEIVDGQLTKLLLQPAEENMFGTHKMLGALFILEPDTYSIGGQVIDRRVVGSRIQAIAAANLIVNRSTGHPEGSFGTLYYGQPLYSADAKWAWKTLITWHDEIFRSYIGFRLRTYDAAATAADDQIPYVYDFARWFAANSVTRSFGRRHKHDLSVGVEVDRRTFRPRDMNGFAPEAVEEFVQSELPVTDTRLSPFFQVRSYTSDYHRVLDFETLGLQEDYRLGHETVLRVYPASSDVVSSRTLLGTYAALGYTAPLGDGLARVLGASTIELGADHQTDAVAQVNTRVVTPRLPFGRIVHDAVVLNRHRNYLNERFALGGDTRLRGYPPAALLGKDVVASNVEIRSRAAQVFSIQVGGTVFYDVGDAFDGFAEMKLKQSTGLGFRAVFPQAERIVFRADWGFPLVEGRPVMPGTLFVTFGQAFGMPILPAPSLETEYRE